VAVRQQQQLDGLKQSSWVMSTAPLEENGISNGMKNVLSSCYGNSMFIDYISP